MARTLAFDIELANVFELAPGEDLEARAPFDIACAAAVEIGGATRHWYEKDASGRPFGHLTPAAARDMLLYLEAAQAAGVRVAAWNGLSFDLRWLGYVANDPALARRVAMELYDPMFQFFVQRGFPVGLAAVASAMGVQETKLMGGADAPKKWAAGEYQLVLDYVAGDCRITNAVVEAIEKERRIRWRTKKGTISSEPIAKLLPVRELIHLPEPDVSWMSSPMPRSKCTAWLAD